MSIDIEKLMEEGYEYSLINQIQKAYNKGYDITTIDKNINIEKLREVINVLPQKEKMDKNALLDIILKVYGVEGKIRHSFKLRPEIQKIIMEGLVQGVNPNAYSYIGTRGYEPRWITNTGIKALEINKDIYDYFILGYNALQTDEIINAYKNGLDIQKYITPSDDITQIIAINKLFEFYMSHKIKEDKLFADIANLKLKRKVMDKVIECLEMRKDISIIFSERIDKSQIGILLTATKKGLNLETMINKKLTPEQLNVIMTGLEYGLDTTLYNNPLFNERQMSNIFKVLKWNKENPDRLLDVKPILNPEVSDYLMIKYLDYHKRGTKEDVKNILDVIKGVKTMTREDNCFEI